MIKGKCSRHIHRVRRQWVSFLMGICLTAGVAAQEESQRILRAVIEIPAWSTVKYEIDAETNQLVVDRLLAGHLRYPGNYGFFPGLPSSDGYALDVLVITRTPLIPGATLTVRPIGVLLMTDRGEDDHKIIAVPSTSVDAWFAAIDDVHDLPEAQRQEITSFFSIYKHTATGSNPVSVAGIRGIDAAAQLLAQAKSLRSPAEERKK